MKAARAAAGLSSGSPRSSSVLSGTTSSKDDESESLVRGDWGLGCPSADSARPFNTSEVNSILAKIAKPGEPVPTSRSLKATCLSWVAKAGVSPPLRKLLGYHVDATELSVNTYSRDLLAPPLRELVRVLSLIASGAFSPDTTRSGYFALNDPGRQDGNDAAPAVLPQPPSASVSADTTAVTGVSPWAPTERISGGVIAPWTGRPRRSLAANQFWNQWHPLKEKIGKVRGRIRRLLPPLLEVLYSLVLSW